MSKEDVIGYDHIYPNLEDWPIRNFAQDRDGFVERLIGYTMNKLQASSNSSLELLNKTVYLEKQRSKNNPWNVDPSDEKKYWRSLESEVEKSKVGDNPELEQAKILRRIVHRYSEEILGDFNPGTFKFARIFLTSLFKRLLNNGWSRGHRGIWGRRDDVRRKLKVDGHIDQVRSLFKKGTVVIVPTHYSNLDSALIGYGIDMKIGIPAFAYGAGLNLYDYELVAYFINRLGAYRVDRRKKNPIYLETLKSMASLSLVEGVNHIFFPGGTRSRSGAIEDKLKLGLLNSVIDAQRHCILNDINQKIFIVPMCVGYHFVLEAKGLIDQHLRVVGKEKYFRTKSSESFIKKSLRFLRRLRKSDSEIYMSLGQPIDVLGNRVDASGASFDKRGNQIYLKNYFSSDDVLNVDSQRESVYTRILAGRIIEGFKKDNVILTSHMAAFVLFTIIEELNPELELFDILKIPTKEIAISFKALVARSKKVIDYLNSLDEGVKFAQTFQKPLEEALKDGIYNVGIYHSQRVIKWIDKSTLGTEDLKLLYYYHNKMNHYNVPKRKRSLEDIVSKM